MKPSSLPSLRGLAAFASPLGVLIAGASEDALHLLEFCDDFDPQARLDALLRAHPQAAVDRDDPLLQATQQQLEEYFGGRRHSFELPLTACGTPFQQRVWKLLRQIPYGETWSYLELAQRSGDPTATRAVGAANGRNPLAVLIPCHRVVNASGALGGYGGGLWRKQRLLDLERGQRTFMF